MTLSTSLRGAARNLINTFGNTGSLYTYSGATTTESEEGDITVSDWKTATSIKVVDSDNLKEELIIAAQGRENMGADEKIIRDDVTVVVNDRLTVDSVEYRVESLTPVYTQDTLVVQIIKISRVTDTTNW